MIYLATDHAGFELKEKIKAYLLEQNFEIEDCGTHAIDPNDDYPDFIKLAAEKVSANPEHNKAIILGGSGQGEAMVANKYAHIRCAVYYGGAEEILRLSRQHNDANILSLGARFLTADQAIEAIRLWLAEPFSQDERHIRRIEKLAALEK